MAKVEFTSAGRNDGLLYRAVINGDFLTVASELSLGDIDLSLKIGGKSFLRHAGERGFKRIADLLIKHGLDPNEQYGVQQRTLLHFSAATRNYGFARVLLENRADANRKTISGATPLHFAARTGQSYLSIALIAAGAHVSAVDNQGRTPLQLAFMMGMADTAKVLSKHGAGHSAPTNDDNGKAKVAEHECSGAPDFN